ncbi:MAG: hydrolase [Clostridiales bacterium]|nr:hydrolase [Clostridiales bacterium]
MIPTPAQALDILYQHNEGEFLRMHGRIVGDVLAWFADQLGYGEEKDYWQAVGILHDLDYEKYPEEHCLRSQEMMREMGMDERIIRSTASHCYGIHVDIAPVHEMEKVLFACDELTGLIGAAAAMRPSRSVNDLEVSSLKKKFKDKRFAAGCSREIIQQGADMLGWDMETLMERTILAMRASENVA